MIHGETSSSLKSFFSLAMFPAGRIYVVKAWETWETWKTIFRSSPPKDLLWKGVLKICLKFIQEHPCRSVSSIKLQSNCIEISLRHRCSPVNLLYIFRTTFIRTPMESSFWILQWRFLKWEKVKNIQSQPKKSTASYKKEYLWLFICSLNLESVYLFLNNLLVTYYISIITCSFIVECF